MAARRTAALFLGVLSLAQAALGGLRGPPANETGNASAAVPGAPAPWAGASQPSLSSAETAPFGAAGAAARSLTATLGDAAAAAGNLTGTWRSNVMTLYHTTSPEVAELILKTGFRPGSGGWCGGAIYFIDTPILKRSKFNPVTTKTGAIIEAKVDMGKVAKMDKKCDASFGHGVAAAVEHGYDSVTFDPDDGDEFVILSKSRVLSMKLYKSELGTQAQTRPGHGYDSVTFDPGDGEKLLTLSKSQALSMEL